MITLPPLRRVSLRSFWLAISVSIGIPIGAFLLYRVPSQQSFILPVVAFIILVLPGLLWPGIVSLPYRAWNRLAREFARCARLFLLRICFGVIVLAARGTASSFRLSRPVSDESMWVNRNTLASSEYFSQYAATSPEWSQKKGWISEYLSWTLRSGNLWASFLLPFLILVSKLDTEVENTLPSDLYTLY